MFSYLRSIWFWHLVITFLGTRNNVVQFFKRNVALWLERQN